MPEGLLPAWVAVSVMAPAPQAEAVADFLVNLTGYGVELRDLEGPEGMVLVKGFLPAGAELGAQRREVEEYVEGLRALAEAPVMVRFEDLPGQDWAEGWRAYFKPSAVTRRLVVAPPWEDSPQLDPGQQVLVIDPGQAFGTGQHESTRLCLRRMEWLAEEGRMGDRVLDVGCGTGILALAALKLGAGEALGLDPDPLAVEAARHNAQLNALQGRFRVVQAALEEFEEPGEFDLVLANLTGRTLVDLAGPLASRVGQGGVLVAGGMLVSQQDEVIRAFEARGFKVLETESMRGWAVVVME